MRVMTEGTSTVNHAHSFEERLSRLEATVETFVLTVSKDIQEQNGNINALRQAIQEQNRTPWHNYIAGFGVLLVVLAMFGSGYVRDLSRVELDVLGAAKEFHEHTADGHPEVALREMKLYRDIDSQHMQEMRTGIRELQEWKRSHSSEDERTHSGHAENLRFLEKELDRQWQMAHPTRENK